MVSTSVIGECVSGDVRKVCLLRGKDFFRGLTPEKSYTGRYVFFIHFGGRGQRATIAAY
jgi:hypothetical protein